MSSRKLWPFGLASALVGGAVAVLILNRRVDRALEAPRSNEQPVEFSALPAGSPLPFWGGEDVDSAVALPGGLYAAGPFGVARIGASRDGSSGLDRVDISVSLPTRRVSAMSAWRTELAVGLNLEGLFIYRDGSWSEVRSGFGTLHVRALSESPAGELWIGAREGLFRMGYAERSMARLHQFSVRSVAAAEGGRVLSGGETGAFITQGGVTTPLRLQGLESPWVDEVEVFDHRIHVLTPTGLFAESKDGVLRSIANGEGVGSMAALGDRLVAVADPPESAVRRFDALGRTEVERLLAPVRRVFRVGDHLVADTQSGLAEQTKGEWRLISKRQAQDSFGNTHVGALAAYRGRIVVGFFDGGLAELVPTSPSGATAPSAMAKADPPLELRSLTRSRSAEVWAVNALVEAGGALHVASLRGAFRFDGSSITTVEGPGAAFSLAQTQSGVAIGYGEGVLLPEGKLLSAFHGLPGNQATAMAAAPKGLLVGTPSGLGFIEDLKVRWRVASGEGRLPHPWVTAILPVGESVLVGTYGGGLTRREGSMTDKGAWRPFPETAGLKINTGCLVIARSNGRIYAGTDGTGLFRLSLDGMRFERLKLSLPSQRITALLERDGFLYIGTDEGLTRWPVEQDVQP